MAGTKARRAPGAGRSARDGAPDGRAGKRRPSGQRSAGARGSRASWAWIIGGLTLAVVAVAVVFALAGGSGSGVSSDGTVVQANGGSWTNITPDTLAARMEHKDFTLLNVKTPYIGEIQGTDLYIPYTELEARAAELPADKAAPIVVYCRSGNESAIASQTLLDLGYTNIENLDGGMNAWTASGRQLIQVARS
jgi:phage shock protein E